MALEDRINQDIKAAMLAKDQAKLRGLRAIKSALLLAKTEKDAGETLSEETEIKVLQKLVKQRKESADIYSQQNRPDLYQIEKEEQEVIETYLPKQLSKEEIAEQVKLMITETQATGIKDMGKVMGQANKVLAGKADGKTIAAIVKELLH
ncbi:GatB/YqeY domain-containing protein [Olivibacter ginsenosidimutans]|uniref:GatB/YqeY domain-containing protein n=1 Tax=Olivibacter ginsenosidimutans TaxID=1176537 RepID=A0ABP9BPL8_9SPHI